MQFDDILKKRLRGMAVRILSNIEHVLGIDDLDSLDDNTEVSLRGDDLKVIRSEILNAAGDTTRSLQGGGGASKPGKLSLSREVIFALNNAEINIIVTDEGSVPIFKVSGDFNILNKIRYEIKSGIVYNHTYICVGIDNIIDSLIPFLDSVQFTGIKLAGGDYQEWRDTICVLYLEGLGNE